MHTPAHSCDDRRSLLLRRERPLVSPGRSGPSPSRLSERSLNMRIVVDANVPATFERNFELFFIARRFLCDLKTTKS